jgi:hypothetical protein
MYLMSDEFAEFDELDDVLDELDEIALHRNGSTIT